MTKSSCFLKRTRAVCLWMQCVDECLRPGVRLCGKGSLRSCRSQSTVKRERSCDFKDVSAAASNSRVGNLGNMEACFRLGSSVNRWIINWSHDPYGHIHCGEAVTLSANFEHEQCQCNLHLSSHSSAVQQVEPLQFHIPLWTIILTARRADNAQHKQLLHSTF